MNSILPKAAMPVLSVFLILLIALIFPVSANVMSKASYFGFPAGLFVAIILPCFLLAVLSTLFIRINAKEAPLLNEEREQ